MSRTTRYRGHVPTRRDGCWATSSLHILSRRASADPKMTLPRPWGRRIWRSRRPQPCLFSIATSLRFTWDISPITTVWACLLLFVFGILYAISLTCLSDWVQNRKVFRCRKYFEYWKAKPCLPASTDDVQWLTWSKNTLDPKCEQHGFLK